MDKSCYCLNIIEEYLKNKFPNYIIKLIFFTTPNDKYERKYRFTLSGKDELGRENWAEHCIYFNWILLEDNTGDEIINALEKLHDEGKLLKERNCILFAYDARTGICFDYLPDNYNPQKKYS